MGNHKSKPVNYHSLPPPPPPGAYLPAPPPMGTYNPPRPGSPLPTYSHSGSATHPQAPLPNPRPSQGPTPWGSGWGSNQFAAPGAPPPGPQRGPAPNLPQPTPVPTGPPAGFPPPPAPAASVGRNRPPLPSPAAYTRPVPSFDFFGASPYGFGPSNPFSAFGTPSNCLACSSHPGFFGGGHSFDYCPGCAPAWSGNGLGFGFGTSNLYNSFPGLSSMYTPLHGTPAFSTEGFHSHLLPSAPTYLMRDAFQPAAAPMYDGGYSAGFAAGQTAALNSLLFSSPTYLAGLPSPTTIAPTYLGNFSSPLSAPTYLGLHSGAAVVGPTYTLENFGAALSAPQCSSCAVHPTTFGGGATNHLFF
eukprot:GGOE01023592.1.p1 GENE.GGOE01023592.1~~GGOE01023592.1.p1  ORF type:complete len:367 (+),score=42.80 GGOE01023592.1:30-1103(+)